MEWQLMLFYCAPSQQLQRLGGKSSTWKLAAAGTGVNIIRLMNEHFDYALIFGPKYLKTFAQCNSIESITRKVSVALHCTLYSRAMPSSSSSSPSPCVYVVARLSADAAGC